MIDSQKFGHIQHTNKQMFDIQNQMFLGLGSKTLGLGFDQKKKLLGLGFRQKKMFLGLGSKKLGLWFRFLFLN